MAQHPRRSELDEPFADLPPRRQSAGTPALPDTQARMLAAANENPMDRSGIDLAVERINRHWRATPRRQPLIAELTLLDWHARTLDDGQTPDPDLIRRISRLRRQIWLSSES